MIKVPFPHMALNAHNAPGVEYKMWNTWKVPKDTPIAEIVSWVATVARNAPGQKLETLIINAHGNSAYVGIGAGIPMSKVGLFNVWKYEGLVNRIWLVVCKVALIEKAGDEKKDGNWFCYRLAQESGAFVTASKNRQIGEIDIPFIDDLPYGYIDNWEGTVYTWNPKGEIVSVWEGCPSEL